MQTNILPDKPQKAITDNGSLPALSQSQLNLLIDGSAAGGVGFGDAAYTANLCTGGTPIESDNAGTWNVAAYAFDGSAAGNSWQAGGGGTTGWIGYQFAAAKIIAKVRIAPWYYYGHAQVKDFTIDGSNDGAAWTTVYTGLCTDTSGWQEYTFSNAVAYTRWRVNIASSYNAYWRVGVFEVEMMENIVGSLKVLLDITGSSPWPVSEVRYLTGETDTAKTAIKTSPDGITYTNATVTDSGQGYLKAAVAAETRFVTIDHTPATAMTAYEIQVMAQRDVRSARPAYRVYQPTLKSPRGGYRVGFLHPASKNAAGWYLVRQKTERKTAAHYHVTQRALRAALCHYHVTRYAIKACGGAYHIRPPMPEIRNPAGGMKLEALALGLLSSGATSPEFTLQLWNGQSGLNDTLKMDAVRITMSLAAEGAFNGGNNGDGREFVDGKWLEVKSNGTTGVGITDDMQATFTPVGGDPAEGGLALGAIGCGTARHLHCRITLPSQVSTAYASNPRLHLSFKAAPAVGFGENHGTYFGG